MPAALRCLPAANSLGQPIGRQPSHVAQLLVDVCATSSSDCQRETTAPNTSAAARFSPAVAASSFQNTREESIAAATCQNSCGRLRFRNVGTRIPRSPTLRGSCNATRRALTSSPMLAARSRRQPLGREQCGRRSAPTGPSSPVRTSLNRRFCARRSRRHHQSIRPASTRWAPVLSSTLAGTSALAGSSG